MERLRRYRPSPAMIVAMIALFVALGGGATAGAFITGAQIKNNTVATKDIRNNTVNSKDVRNESLRTQDIRNGTLLAEDFKSGVLPAGGTAGPQGPAGQTGATGPAGPQGPAGPLLTTLPSGQTLMGVQGAIFNAQAGMEQVTNHFTFQFPLPAPPTPHFIANGAMAPPQCPGTAAAPQAQAGHLCVYESAFASPTNVASIFLSNPITNQTGTVSHLGFSITVVATAAGQAGTTGSWAVTAP